MTRLAYIAAAFLVLPVLGIIGWLQLYPQPDDPKNFHYVLWKYGVAPMDLDDAASGVTFDPDREKMLLGSTEAQLRDRFGYLVALDRSEPFLRRCLIESGWAKEGRLYFIRHSGLVVIFKNGVATDVLNTKSC